MGMLESVIGGVLGQVFGGRQGGAQGGGMSPLVKALLMLLLAKGASGGFGDIFGRGHGHEAGPEADRSEPAGRGPFEHGPSGGDLGDDIGGYDQAGGRRDTGLGRGSDQRADYGTARDDSLPGGGFDDLSGMLGGGGPAPTARGPAPSGGAEMGGLDGLVDRFREAGLGDVIGSWIGGGANRAVSSDQLARALGDDTLGALQQQTGMDRTALLSDLAQALPEVVHALTPQGRVPGEDERRGW